MDHKTNFFGSSFSDCTAFHLIRDRSQSDLTRGVLRI